MSPPSIPRPPLLQRLPGAARATIAFALDGSACSGFAGDTLLTAILTQTDALRRNEGDGNSARVPRAGFCLMGACQDCWVELEGGERLRACTTPLEAGMRVRSGLAENAP